MALLTMQQIPGHDPFGFELVTRDGDCTWEEDWLREALGYETKAAFRNVITKARKACMAAHINDQKEFGFWEGPNGGKFTLTRVACFMIVMNADSRKHEVASLQVYLSQVANVVASHFEQVENVARVLTRGELTEELVELSDAAQQHGVVHFDRFLDAGYRGMYNMSLKDLEKYKGLPPGEKLLDWMQSGELASNLHRVSKTDKRLRKFSSLGQKAAEDEAHRIGLIIRNADLEIDGEAPEDIPLADTHISEAKRRVRTAERQLRDHDSKPRLTRLLDTLPEPPSMPADMGYTKDPDEDSD